MSDDLTAFIAARLDEDEAGAKAATPGPWAVDSEGCCVFTGDRDEVAERCQDESARHIARNDPARVLRDVAAKRNLLALYDTFTRPVSPLERTLWPSIAGTLRYALCDAAVVWNDHPDYRQEWAP